MVDTDPDEVAAVLRDCEEALIELKENHRLVQDGPKAFAELAARLRAEFDRRSGIDRRNGSRDSDGRRADEAKSA